MVMRSGLRPRIVRSRVRCEVEGEIKDCEVNGEAKGEVSSCYVLSCGNNGAFMSMAKGFQVKDEVSDIT